MKKFLIVDDSVSWVNHHTFNIKYILGENNIEICQAFSAKEGAQIISENLETPFDVIFTDMQMEPDFLPLNAGEWFIKQIQFYPQYKNSSIVIISASPRIKQIAETYGVDYLPKKMCDDITSYENLLKNYK